MGGNGVLETVKVGNGVLETVKVTSVREVMVPGE
jgi:hypothetical protein